MKEVFVFGAGASNDSAKAPLGKDLVWTYYQDCFTFPEIKADGKPDLTEEDISFANLSIFFELVEKVYPNLKGEKKKWEETRKQNQIYSPPYNLDKRYYVDEMLRILHESKDKRGVELIRSLISEHIGGSSFDGENLLYKKFVKSLAGKPSESISIISINFDCLLHEDFKNKVYFDYLIGFDEIDSNRISYNKQKSIPLIKLNGSLDWAICPKCKKTFLRFPFIVQHSYKNFYCKMTENCGEKLYPLIFLPYEDRDKSIDRLWNKAKEELRQAQKITIIGYSFPPYDQHIINLFGKYMNTDVLLEIVDLEEEVENKQEREKEIREWLKNIFPNKKDIKLSLDGFREYIK